MNLLVIGNSHVGSIKRGHELVKRDFNHFEVKFLAARSDGLKTLEVENGLLFSHSSEVANSIRYTLGYDALDLNLFKPDAIWFYGLEFHLHLDYFLNSLNRIYSEAFINFSLDSLLNSWNYKLVRKIRQYYHGEIFVSHPRTAEREPISKHSGPYFQSSEQLDTVMRFANQLLSRSLGAQYLMQPHKTLNLRTMETIKHFSKGSRRLAVGDDLDNAKHPESDLRHMNDEFGAIFFCDLLHRLERLKPQLT